MVNGDWVFDDYAEGGAVTELGVEPGNPPVVLRAPRAASAASSSADGATPASAPSSGSPH
jgi:hypothetical protein